MRIVAVADTHLFHDELVITSRPHRHKIVVAGNHDWAFVRGRALARGLFETSEVTPEGIRFYGSPWQPAFNDRAFNLPRSAALAAKWDAIPTGLDVLVTHSPPGGLGDRSPVGSRAGCADLRARVVEVAPRLHLFGHIHQDGGAWREGANVTTWECERAPTVIDLEPDGVTRVAVPPSGRD